MVVDLDNGEPGEGDAILGTPADIVSILVQIQAEAYMLTLEAQINILCTKVPWPHMHTCQCMFQVA